MASGDEDIQLLLKTLLRKELIQKPPMFHRGFDINVHLSKMDHFFNSIAVRDSGTKISMLTTTLEDDIYSELCCQCDFNESRDYEWICNKLKKMFHQKQSDASPLIKLLELKQKEEQSLKDFLSEIRIEAFKLTRNMNSDQREKLMTVAFIEGLLNQKVAVAVKALNPSNLDNAYSLVKKEEPNFGILKSYARKVSENINYENNNNLVKDKEIDLLKKEISLMRKQISVLMQYVYDNKRPMYDSRNNQHKKNFIQQNNKQTIRCYNCNRDGHFVRDCDKPIECKKCGKTNHVTHFCRERNSYRMRNVSNENNDDFEYKNSSIQEENINNHNESEQDFFYLDSYHKSNHRGFVKKQRKPHFSTNKKSFFSKEVQDWNKFINGSAKRPKPSGKTLISETHTEKAMNKPIIRGQLAGKSGKIFLDTGSEVNLIDKNTFDKLSGMSDEILFEEKPFNIKCANGSKMETFGKASIECKIGNTISRQNFIVTKDLFPRVFIGIKTMKDMNIVLNPKSDGISINNMYVPFISGIQSNLCRTAFSGNSCQPLL